MPGKFKYTSQMLLAKQVLEFIDWELERTEHQKMVDNMLGSLEQNMGRARGPRVLNTMQVVQLREESLQAAKNHAGSLSNKSGMCTTFVKPGRKPC